MAENIGQSTNTVNYGISSNGALGSLNGNSLIIGDRGLGTNGAAFCKSSAMNFWPQGSDAFAFGNQNAVENSNVQTSNLAEIAYHKADVPIQNDVGASLVEVEGPGHSATPSLFVFTHHHSDLV
jgi:hypothetical protein